MGKVKGKHRLDKYYHFAKEHGYRSRAAWKLVQLDSKFGFLRSSRSVLDLCAAPGGWMQVCVERVPVGSLVLGVDLDPIRPIRGAVSLQQDITEPKCRAAVKRLMAENGCTAFDLVLHDGSPNVGGAWAKEATTQNALVIDSVKLATELLAPKGNFITKVFRSQDYTSVLYCLRQLFEKVEVDKPAASRSASAEIYVLGFNYKAPAKIDPRLLDFKHLFQSGKEPAKVVDVLRGTKQKRHRDGYEDGDTTLRKLSSASEFIWSVTPLDILGSVTSITFNDPDSLPLKDHALTTEEVKSLCDDLRVLGKQDFKHLLKWRISMRKALSPSEKTTVTPSTDEHEIKVDEDEKLLNEMDELTDAMERKKKRSKKLLAKREAKDKARKALGKQTDVTEDGYNDLELFSLSSMKGKNDLVAVDNNEYEDDIGEIGNSESEDSHDDAEEGSHSDLDSEEERKRYDEQVENLLDEAYERFLSKKDGSTKQRKRAKQEYSKDDQLEGDDDTVLHSDQDSDNEKGDREANPLMIPLAEDEPTQEEIAAKWFSQDVFMDGDEHEKLGNDDSEDEIQIELPVQHPRVSVKKMEDSSEQTLRQKKATKVDDDFEIVPAPDTDSSDSSSDESDDDDDIETKAEILACAKKMLTKKQRELMIDDAYNKYMFHDEGLPKWFLDEEMKHRVPVKPVSKEEIAAMKKQFREIDARPAKKVAEAKARKKRAAHKKLEKVRKKANTISDQADISDRSKNKMIEQLYKKATAAPRKPQKEYVVAKKGVQVRPGKGKVVVDRRMKKDARKKGMSKQGKDKKGGKQRGKGSSMKGSGKGRGKERK
ncbi:FtsJ-like methyltransferase family protein [Perilla frutescens var. hirtella]|uniref:Putative rRNA methyltransferase n=1 Tax=Perilla frutescens var. hirtella TaxID=608512 RepID=A0AAD4NXI2_PERFH|nr:FtsJ-like methyltransferase family protein [Perilla frutescens var. hirtella]